LVAEGGAAEGAGEGGAVGGSREGDGGKEGAGKAAASAGKAAAARLPLSLSSLFRWRLARVRRVVVGPAEMGLTGLRFKAGERR
jgi:hypothetical protein